MTETDELTVWLVVDGEYVYDAPYRLADRAPTKSERANYGQLKRWAKTQYHTEDVRAFYVHQADERAGPFYAALERLGYDVQSVTVTEQYERLQNGLLRIGLAAYEGDWVVYVGGADGGKIERERNERNFISKQLQTLRDVGLNIQVLAFKGWNDFDEEDFPPIDLVGEVGLMPPSLFSRDQMGEGTESTDSSWETSPDPSRLRRRSRRQ